MFDRFPKKRPPLSPEHARVYETHFRENREGCTLVSNLTQRMEGWLHRQVARDLTKDSGPKSTLEIGAGSLNHLRHEPDLGPYDIVEPSKRFLDRTDESARLRHAYTDIREVPQGTEYDRIISVATFEHLCDLPWVIARCGILLKAEGVLRVSIPSEGELLWGLGWRLTAALEFRIRYGLDYSHLMKHEHVNSSHEIEEALRYFFRDVRVRVFGLNRYLSFYQFFACRKPHLERCRTFFDKEPPAPASESRSAD